MIDGFHGRLFAVTSAATDTYAESQFTFPTVTPIGAGASTQILVPVITRIEMLWAANLGAISADAELRGCIYNGDIGILTDILGAGLSDPLMIFEWRQANALTTSGEVIVQNYVSWEPPGDGVLLVNQALALQQHNVGTGISVGLTARVWYDYAQMNQTAYLLALHGM